MNENLLSNSAYFFTEHDKQKLLSIARKSLQSFFHIETKIDDEFQFSELLNKPCGAFVSAHKQGELRGCLGVFKSEKPLYETIAELTVSAATCDYRFLPVQEYELGDINLEISVLTPMNPIQSVHEIELGKHGIYIKQGSHSGTFLPQVATQTGWSAEEFLGHCARDKAGIGWEGWKTAKLFTYEAIVFSENDFK